MSYCCRSYLQSSKCKVRWTMHISAHVNVQKGAGSRRAVVSKDCWSGPLAVGVTRQETMRLIYPAHLTLTGRCSRLPATPADLPLALAQVDALAPSWV